MTARGVNPKKIAPKVHPLGLTSTTPLNTSSDAKYRHFEAKYSHTDEKQSHSDAKNHLFVNFSLKTDSRSKCYRALKTSYVGLYKSISLVAQEKPRPKIQQNLNSLCTILMIFSMTAALPLKCKTNLPSWKTKEMLICFNTEYNYT